jgi:hypothetical protein
MKCSIKSGKVYKAEIMAYYYKPQGHVVTKSRKRTLAFSCIFCPIFDPLTPKFCCSLKSYLLCMHT